MASINNKFIYSLELQMTLKISPVPVTLTRQTFTYAELIWMHVRNYFPAQNRLN